MCLQFGHSGDPCPNQTVRNKYFYVLDAILKHIYRLILTTRKTARAEAMKFQRVIIRQLPTRMHLNLASAAQDLGEMTRMATQ